jgi:protein gp37
MSGNSKIEWTEKTWNPVTGCSKVSQGCKHCYAEREFPRVYPGRAFTDVRVHEDRLDAPLHWRKPAMIFVNSMSDLFHPDVPDAFLCSVFKVICEAKQHNFQVLTKRPTRMREFLSRWDSMTRDFGPLWPYTWPRHNVWLGVSIEDQATADERIPLLQQTPAAVRWVSYEPALGAVDLERGGFSLLSPMKSPSGTQWPGLNWVVCGGESGPKARPMHPDWARSMRDQCQAAGVPFFFKQWGEWVEREMARSLIGDDSVARAKAGTYCTLGQEFFHRVGKHAAGRLLDGVKWDDYPERAA